MAAVDPLFYCAKAAVYFNKGYIHNNIGDVGMITVSNAESHLKNKIGDDTNNIKKVWDVFKIFCKEPVEEEEEKQILFECGIYDFTGEELFHFGFVRQFSIFEDDEYDHMEQLHCLFYFKPTEELRTLEVAEWSMDYDDLDTFFNHIENLKEFKYL